MECAFILSREWLDLIGLGRAWTRPIKWISWDWRVQLVMVHSNRRYTDSVTNEVPISFVPLLNGGSSFWLNCSYTFWLTTNCEVRWIHWVVLVDSIQYRRIQRSTVFSFSTEAFSQNHGHPDREAVCKPDVIAPFYIFYCDEQGSWVQGCPRGVPAWTWLSPLFQPDMHVSCHI